MPRKIGFSVVNCSSHEDNFTAKELMVHAPTANGWKSSRLCSYPQDITIQLVERSRVRKLQLLAHQYLIPAKVEFHIGDSLPESSSPGFPGQLRRLGYVILSDNEVTGFKARELKSVYVDAVGTYLRIIFDKNHVNKYNHYKQVALVAINVLGDSLDSFSTIPSREQLIDHYLNCTQQEAALDTTFMGLTPSKHESFSPYDDLAFEMYQDPEVAHIIRHMDQQKRDVVRQENFEQAKCLRQAIADLQKVGECLARWDVEKQCAIEKEDYDLAKEKKELMEEFRRRAYQKLQDQQLLDITMIVRTTDLFPTRGPPSLLSSPGHSSLPAKSPVSTDTPKKERKDNTPQKQPSSTDTHRQRSSQHETPGVPATKSHLMSLPHDEKPLPAHQRREQVVEIIHSPAEQRPSPPHPHRSPVRSEMSREPEPLTENAQREAGLPIDVFGESLVAGAYSKNWAHREEALLVVQKRLVEVSPTSPKEELRNTIRASVFLVKKALQDQVSSVLQASLNLLRLLLSQLIPSLGLGRAEINYCVDQTWPNLLARTGDSAGRLRTPVMALIQELAVLKEVRALQTIPADLLKPLRPKCPQRLAQSQVELLERLLSDLGTENSGFNLDNVMRFSAVALQHSVPGVREAAHRIILSMYQRHRGAVLSYLPPRGKSKDFLYKQLFDGFAKIDGKLEETQRGDEQKEKEEIHSLQEQLAALKEITEAGCEVTRGQVAKMESPQDEKQSKVAAEATASRVPDGKIHDRADVQESVDYLDNFCIFCGKKDESFTEDGLDLHYWKHCPMLRRCDECRQVVEIASLTDHLLGECENSSRFSRCPRCSEAVSTEDLAHHAEGPACHPPVSARSSNHCPLCHNNFMPGEEAWKAHLMGAEGCKQNSRRTVVSQRTQPAQGRAVGGGARLKQSRTTGSRGRPVGSRIPALAPHGRGHSPGKR